MILSNPIVPVIVSIVLFYLLGYIQGYYKGIASKIAQNAIKEYQVNIKRNKKAQIIKKKDIIDETLE